MLSFVSPDDASLIRYIICLHPTALCGQEKLNYFIPVQILAFKKYCHSPEIISPFQTRTSY